MKLNKLQTLLFALALLLLPL
ncbi:MAG: hypothetical protein RIS48_1904, partial [Pseudomonadota bacterium]